LGFGSVATIASIASVGCVPATHAGSVDLVWGRRGLSEGRFLKPRAITIDDQDHLYIVDTTGRIQVFDADGNFLRSWTTPATENGRPTGLGFVPANRHRSGQARLLVADTHYYRMIAYTLDGQLDDEATIGGTSGKGDGEFAFVTDVACDAQGNYFVGEYNQSDRIQKFDRDGKFVMSFGGYGSEPGRFVRPQSLMIRDNVLWVADSCNHRLQRFDLSGDQPQWIDSIGGPGTGIGQMYYPYGLDFTADGIAVVVEYKNARLQFFDDTGKSLGTWGGHGFDDGQLNQPWGVVVDSKNRIHVLDSNNHRVQRIAAGII
jgi:DNA-binding beta-propeller fold protein YncE